MNLSFVDVLYGGEPSQGAVANTRCEGHVTLNNSSIRFSATDGLYNLCGTLTPQNGPNLVDNTFQDNIGCAVLLDDPQGRIDPSGNTATGNRVNGICLNDRFGSATLKAADSATFPYVAAGFTGIPAGASVIIDPGAVVKFDQGKVALSAALRVAEPNLSFKQTPLTRLPVAVLPLGSMRP